MNWNAIFMIKNHSSIAFWYWIVFKHILQIKRFLNNRFEAVENPLANLWPTSQPPPPPPPANRTKNPLFSLPQNPTSIRSAQTATKLHFMIKLAQVSHKNVNSAKKDSERWDSE